MKIAICGCQHIDDVDLDSHLDATQMQSDFTIVTGGKRPIKGVPASVEAWCQKNNINFELKGNVKNPKSLADVEHMVAFWDGRSEGTRDAIETAVRQGIPVDIFPL